MTRAEFDVWIEAHYGQLKAVAKRRVRTGYEDVLQSAIVGMLDSSGMERTPAALAWPWAVGFVRYSARHARVSAQRQKAAYRTEKIIRRAAPIQGQENTE